MVARGCCNRLVGDCLGWVWRGAEDLVRETRRTLLLTAMPLQSETRCAPLSEASSHRILGGLYPLRLRPCHRRCWPNFQAYVPGKPSRFRGLNLGSNIHPRLWLMGC